ncbi:uncharacterized protein conserved in archaea [Rothia mucilaginosa DY-18]|uniref:Uncharacterized protein conserved in archaea n=1 Tax=Rothia mucilaginosa (strain DY-18) TaxID=680646 RepID=D2NQC5_ROTMD|nr:uncharacterized protein conserved in archaea [Rothia mucilaginosa DY-18]
MQTVVSRFSAGRAILSLAASVESVLDQLLHLVAAHQVSDHKVGVAGIHGGDGRVAVVEGLHMRLSLRILPNVHPGSVVAQLAQLRIQSLAVGAAGAPINDDATILHDLACLLLIGLLTFKHSSSIDGVLRGLQEALKPT